MVIKSDNIYLEDKIISGYISVQGSKIIEISENKIDGEILDLSDLKIIPGLVDIHVHGGFGHDTMDATYEAIEGMSKFKVLEGVTSFCPTTVTSSEEKTEKAIKNVVSAIKKGVSGAKIIGTFLEGPFINKDYKGAHPEEHIKEIDFDIINNYINLGEGTIKSVAIAPEKENAQSLIKKLSEKNINVRIGHSGATCEQVFEAVENGANIAIHTYNAMSPFTHRSPGFVGAVLIDDKIYPEIISDLVHSDKNTIKVLVKCKKDKIILITDCMSAGGLEDGDYMLGELEVVVKDSIARLHDGTLAGSTLNLINAIKNMNEVIGVDLLTAINMASLNPSKSLGIDDKIGSLKEGKQADIVGIDDNFNVKFVMIDGVKL